MEDTALRRAKIVATIGPACDDPDTIAAMAEAGMDVARINTSHTDQASLEALMGAVDAAREQVDRPIATMVDLAGPEVRTGAPQDTVTLADGDAVTLTQDDTVTAECIGLSIDPAILAVEDRLLLADGRITLRVTETGESVTAVVEDGGSIAARVGVHLPDTEREASVPTEQDRQDIATAMDHDVDLVAASFVADADDVYAVMAALEEHGGDRPVIAKVEDQDAVDNLAGIIDAAYGVMVARGDLGVDCPLEEVPTIQKRIIRSCREAGTPVITATEMLESMVHGDRPTRAEASDVANAVLDGTDAVMLSGETAIGDRPVAVVETMDRLVRSVERSDEYAALREQHVPETIHGATNSLARSARDLAEDVNAAAIIVESESGYTALKAAKFRPPVPIVVTTPDAAVARQLALSWGVRVEHTELTGDTTDAILDAAVAATTEAGAIRHGDTVVIMSGMLRALEGVRTTDLLKIHVAADRLAAGHGVVDGHGTGRTVRIDDTQVPALDDDAVLVVPEDVSELSGGLEHVTAVLYERRGQATPVAMTARRHDIPTICGVDPDAVPTDETVTVDAERGVVYRGRTSHH